MLNKQTFTLAVIISVAQATELKSMLEDSYGTSTIDLFGSSKSGYGSKH
jgi:hypothetical protein